MAFALTQRSKKPVPLQAKGGRAKKQAAGLSHIEQAHDAGRMGFRQPVSAAFGTPVIQAKLKIGEPDDQYEKEADRVADEVMRMPDPIATGAPADTGASGSGKQTGNGSFAVQRMCTDCAMEKEDKLQRKPLADNTPTLPRISALNGPVAARFPLANNPSAIQRMEMDDEDYDDEMVQMKSAEGGSAVPAVTPGVQAGINSLKGGGQPLSASTRAFFEPRFEVDFSGVRVHSDARAAGLARSVNARAFTHGRNVVFGAGEYSPDALGRKLLAHELTHVTQQEKAAFPTVQCAPDRGQQRTSSGPTKRELKRDKFLRKLARWPAEAHQAWRKLSGAEQVLVLLYMGERYGEKFAREFKQYTKTGAHFEARHYSSRADLLKGFGKRAQKVVNFLAPKNLRARSYKLFTIDALNEWWVHPSGAQITVALGKRESTDKKEKARKEEKAQAANETVIEGTEGWPTRLDPNADREDLFGPIIVSRENADVAFGTGDMVLYENGTIELFLEGTTESYVFRPLPGGGYIVYGPDGRRFDMVWLMPEEDIPDPNTDIVEW